jgi:hypothetical protein
MVGVTSSLHRVPLAPRPRILLQTNNWAPFLSSLSRLHSHRCNLPLRTRLIVPRRSWADPSIPPHRVRGLFVPRITSCRCWSKPPLNQDCHAQHARRYHCGWSSTLKVPLAPLLLDMLLRMTASSFKLHACLAYGGEPQHMSSDRFPLPSRSPVASCAPAVALLRS